jgi:hypothetical protein
MENFDAGTGEIENGSDGGEDLRACEELSTSAQSSF